MELTDSSVEYILINKMQYVVIFASHFPLTLNILSLAKEMDPMATTKQREAARRNIKSAQKKWNGMDRRQHAKSQPEGRARARIGTKGEGNFYRIEVRDKNQFTTFRYHDVGEKGHLMRLSGKRPSGSWGTAAWLVEKGDAHVEGSALVPDTQDARHLFNTLSSKPKKVKGDIFEAKDRRNVPEREKPTSAQMRARTANIKKAQQSRQA